MSVRQIPPNRRSVTGRRPSPKNGSSVPFESGLERDFATILEFDQLVAKYEAQPLFVFYRSPNGRKVQGVPDFLVTFREDTGFPQMLCDVKYRRELFEKWPVLKPRLKAARAYALAHGQTYRIKTEVEIRTPYLYNAKFLLAYMRFEPDPDHEGTLFAALAQMESATPQTLLEACSNDPWQWAQLIPTLWTLIGRRRLGIDLDQPLTMKSSLWYPRVEP